MPEMSGLDVVAATYDPIHDLGTAMFIGPDTQARAKEWGWNNPIAFYFAGRGGTLGDVDADVVASVFGWFNPAVVAAMYNEGIAVHGPGEAVRRMVESNALWGRDHLSGAGLDDWVAVAERLVDGAEGGGRPLFVGWRSQPRADDGPARAAQLLQVLREWRGANHLVATTAVGLSPLEAILTNEGEGQAKFFGWPEPFADVSAIRHKHGEAEEMTNRLCAADIERLLSAKERSVFAAGVARARSALA